MAGRSSNGTGGALGARRIRPPARAVIGAVLVVVAVAGVLGAHRAADRPPSTRYVVAVRPLAAGTTLSARDLATVTAELPADLAVVPAEQVEGLIGRVTRHGIGELGLVRPDDVLEEGRFAGTDEVELAVDLPPAAALAGTVDVGDVVDVLATDPDGTGTRLVASGVRVTEIDGATEEAIGAAGSVRVRLAVEGSELAATVVDAAARSTVTLTLPAPDRGAGT